MMTKYPVIETIIAFWIVFFFLPLSATAVKEQPAEGGNKGCVILLHGLARSSSSMNKMAAALKKQGYPTVNLDYPSRKYTVEHLAMSTLPEGLQQCGRLGPGQIHFVTHSMGGILLRFFHRQRKIENIGRVVMLSPPNQGSEAADYLKQWSLHRWYNGPAGQQLGTGPESIPNRLGPVDFTLGVITGNTHAFFDGWLADEFPGPNDGKVSVERAKVRGMADFMVLPYSHPFIMEADEVIAQTLFFLEHGRFKRQEPESEH